MQVVSMDIRVVDSVLQQSHMGMEAGGGATYRHRAPLAPPPATADVLIPQMY